MALTRSVAAWLDRLKRSRRALWLLGVFSFFETIIIPIPIEIILVPFMAANRHRVWRIATVVTAGCLLAALVGYGVGNLLYRSVGTWFIETFGYDAEFESFRMFFDEHGFAAVLIVGVLPIPFQLAMLTAGVAGYSVSLFVLAALIARGIRYYGLAWLVLAYGQEALRLWRRHALVGSLVAALALAAFVIVTQQLASLVV